MHDGRDEVMTIKKDGAFYSSFNAASPHLSPKIVENRPDQIGIDLN